MSQENVTKFMEKANSDKAVMDKIEAAGGDIDAIVQVASDAGFTFTAQDFLEYARALPQPSKKLSESELEQVSGGYRMPPPMTQPYTVCKISGQCV
jgi:predicted ribosomally synthesized peptide with nif11-like leader